MDLQGRNYQNWICDIREAKSSKKILLSSHMLEQTRRQ